MLRSHQFFLLGKRVPSLADHSTDFSILIRMENLQTLPLLCEKEIVSCSVRSWSVRILLGHLFLSPSLATGLYLPSNTNHLSVHSIQESRQLGELGSPIRRYVIQHTFQLLSSNDHRYKVAKIKFPFDGTDYGRSDCFGWIHCDKEENNQSAAIKYELCDIDPKFLLIDTK